MIQTPNFSLSVAGEMTIIPMNKLNMYNTVYILDGHWFVMFAVITHV